MGSIPEVVAAGGLGNSPVLGGFNPNKEEAKRIVLKQQAPLGGVRTPQTAAAAANGAIGIAGGDADAKAASADAIGVQHNNMFYYFNPYMHNASPAAGPVPGPMVNPFSGMVNQPPQFGPMYSWVGNPQASIMPQPGWHIPNGDFPGMPVRDPTTVPNIPYHFMPQQGFFVNGPQGPMFPLPGMLPPMFQHMMVPPMFPPNMLVQGVGNEGETISKPPSKRIVSKGSERTPSGPGREIAPGSRERRSATSSNFRGVSWHKRDRKWVARVWVNGKTINLGSFAAEEAAACRVDLALLKERPNEKVQVNIRDPQERERICLEYGLSFSVDVPSRP